MNRLYEALAKAIDAAPVIPPCQVTDPEIWFPESGGENFQFRMAKKFCSQCPVQKECAEYAISEPDLLGIWGGLTVKDRQRIRGLGKGRPRNVA